MIVRSKACLRSSTPKREERRHRRRELAPDFFDHDGPGGKPIDREGDKSMMRGMHARFPDLQATIEDMIAEGDKVVCRNVWRATHSASGKKISFKGIVIWRFANDKLVERWASVEEPR